MRVAVIADIHGNQAALEPVLAAIERSGEDEIWCLGDIVGLGADTPAAVVDLVRERCTLVLAGNHDRWVTGDLPLDMLPLPRQRAELHWQRTQLSAEHLDWLARLPAHASRGDVELWHGNAEDPVTGWISSAEDAADHLARQHAAIGVVGHTHRPLIARLHDQGADYDEHPDREDLTDPGRAVLNPGAVIATGCWLELDLDTSRAAWHTT